MKGFCCSAVLLPVIIIIISTWSKEKSLWSDSLDLTSQPNPSEYARKQQIKTKQSWIWIEDGFLELPNGSSYRPLVYIKFSPTTGRGAYSHSISGEACWGRSLTPRPYSMGLGLHFVPSFRGRLRLGELSWNSDVPLKRYGFVFFDDLNINLTQSIQTKIWP